MLEGDLIVACCVVYSLSLFGIHDFCSKQEDLSGVIDPEEEGHEGACCAVGGLDAAMGEVEAEGVFLYGEDQRGENSPTPHMFPGDVCVWEGFKQYSE